MASDSFLDQRRVDVHKALGAFRKNRAAVLVDDLDVRPSVVCSITMCVEISVRSGHVLQRLAHEAAGDAKARSLLIRDRGAVAVRLVRDRGAEALPAECGRVLESRPGAAGRPTR